MLSGTCGDAVSYEILRTAAEAFSPPGGQGRCAGPRRSGGWTAWSPPAKPPSTAAPPPERHGAAPHISVLVKDETLAQAAPGSTPRRRRPIGTRRRPGRARARAGAACRGTGHQQPGRGTARPGHRLGPMAPADGSPGLVSGAPPGADRARHHADRPAGPGPVLRRPDRRHPLGRRPAPRRRPHRRTEPPGLRRALEARDQGCRWTRCGALAAWATAHHIKPWSRRRHQPGRPGPVLPRPPPLLHPHPGLDHHRRPQRHPALHPPRRLAHPRQPPSRHAEPASPDAGSSLRSRSPRPCPSCGRLPPWRARGAAWRH